MSEKSLTELLGILLEYTVEQHNAIENDDMDELGDILDKKQVIIEIIDGMYPDGLKSVIITDVEKNCLSKIKEQDIINKSLVDNLYLECKKSLKEINVQKSALNYETLFYGNESVYFDSKK